MPALSVRRWALLLALASMIVASAAARQAAQQQPQAIQEEPAMAITLTTGKSAHGTAAEPPSLLTYYFDMEKPDVQLLPAAQGSGRPGRTPLRVQLSGAAAVSTFMPVVSPRPTGMTHQVVKTWDALKNYALMFARVTAINNQAAPNSPRLFPLPGIAVTAAADSTAAITDVGAMIDAAEAHGQRDVWTETSPGSMLLMPAGASVAAVADIMGITHDAAADTITLNLDIVHDPDMVSEFDHHGKQTLDAKTSHYHLATPAGVKVDAAGLLKVLQESDYKLPALHAFVKGRPCVDRVTLTQTTTAGVTTVTATFYCNTGSVDYCTSFQIRITGKFEIDETSSPCSGSPLKLPGDRQGNTVYQQAVDGVWWARGRVVGAVQMQVVEVNSVEQFSNLLTIGGPSQLVLAPEKAYRHVHERVAVTALALSDGGTAVPGVPITFAVAGDCGPLLASATATTDASGQAVAYVSAEKPGAVAVVAAALSGSGAKLVTPPAHIIFFGDHEYVEHKEREYYGRRDHDDRYGATEGYGEAKPDADSDAERFAAEATKKALAQLPA